MKKISITSKPQQAPTLSPDNWVSERAATEEIKRLTIDIPVDLHRRIKSQCANRRVNMAEEIRRLLESNFPHEAAPKLSSAN